MFSCWFDVLRLCVGVGWWLRRWGVVGGVGSLCHSKTTKRLTALRSVYLLHSRILIAICCVSNMIDWQTRTYYTYTYVQLNWWFTLIKWWCSIYMRTYNMYTYVWLNCYSYGVRSYKTPSTTPLKMRILKVAFLPKDIHLCRSGLCHFTLSPLRRFLLRVATKMGNDGTP